MKEQCTLNVCECVQITRSALANVSWLETKSHLFLPLCHSPFKLSVYPTATVLVTKSRLLGSFYSIHGSEPVSWTHRNLRTDWDCFGPDAWYSEANFESKQLLDDQSSSLTIWPTCRLSRCEEEEDEALLWTGVEVLLMGVELLSSELMARPW